MTGTVRRGELAALVYRIGRSEATGRLALRERDGTEVVLWLRRGYLVAVDDSRAPAQIPPGLGGASARDRRRAERLLERLACVAEADFSLDLAAAPPIGRGDGPIALVAWARQHIEAGFDAAAARSFAATLWGARLAARKHLLPDPALLDDTDRRILEAMAAPRRLDELESSARAPRFRLLLFLRFLAAIDALELRGVAARTTSLATAAITA